jgi:hypothetical protein
MLVPLAPLIVGTLWLVHRRGKSVRYLTIASGEIAMVFRYRTTSKTSLPRG